jgi:hypothetical protein
MNRLVCALAAFALGAVSVSAEGQESGARHFLCCDLLLEGSECGRVVLSADEVAQYTAARADAIYDACPKPDKNGWRITLSVTAESAGVRVGARAMSPPFEGICLSPHVHGHWKKAAKIPEFCVTLEALGEVELVNGSPRQSGDSWEQLMSKVAIVEAGTELVRRREPDDPHWVQHWRNHLVCELNQHPERGLRMYAGTGYYCEDHGSWWTRSWNLGEKPEVTQWCDTWVPGIAPKTWFD